MIEKMARKGHGLGRMKFRSSKREGVFGLIILIVVLCLMQILFLYQGNEEQKRDFSMSWVGSVIDEEDVLALYRPENKQRQTYTEKRRIPSNESNFRHHEFSYQQEVYVPTVQLLHGSRRRYKGFLTIGIPSVRRPGTNSEYLFETISSIIKNTSPVDRPTVVLVIYLGDTNTTYNDQVGNHIYRKYKFYLDTGFIQIIKMAESVSHEKTKVNKTLTINEGGGYYSQMKMKAKKKHYDKTDRVKWRTKQNIDIATLMFYCKNISEYYIHIEDDVITSEHFIADISEFIGANSHWFLLEFSNLGFIGKLFESIDLDWISNFLMKNSDSKPCDLLLGKMRVTKGQHNPIHSPYSLFQHIGRYSSLKGKMMPSLDVTFKDWDRAEIPMQELPKGDNPPAEIQTSFDIVDDYPSRNAYDNNQTTYCWSKTPNHGDYFILKFTQPWNLTRIIISSGTANQKKDSIRSGTLDVATKSRATKNKVLYCGLFSSIANFVDGEIDTDILNIKVPRDVICLKISLKSFNKAWLILRDIILMT